MKLSTLSDFFDDALISEYTPEMVESLLSQFKEYGFSRMYLYYYGVAGKDNYLHTDRTDEPYSNWHKTAKNMPNSSKVFADAAKKVGIESVIAIKTNEQGLWLVYSPYYTKNIEGGVPHLGGKILEYTKFLAEHPELRIKRRSYDIDPDAVNKVICSIKLYKQNDAPTRIKKEHISIYTSPDNSYYKPYAGDFTVTESIEPAREDIIISGHSVDYKDTFELVKKGDPIRVLTLSGLSITDRFAAVRVQCGGECDKFVRFTTTPYHGITCHDENGNEICSSRGGSIRPTVNNVPYLDAGFGFDDGFGNFRQLDLDGDSGDSYIAVAKGKNEYTHTTLCECEPEVREYWLSILEQTLDDDHDYYTHRVENHGIHVDEPFAYGYNDCIKEEYFRRYGECSEQEMDTRKIAKIRGDAYTELFIEAAKRIRARGKKVILPLNVEMLRDPIPVARRIAYPMNVEWQWERWLEEIRPDEINIRTYFTSPQFLMTDPQCKKFIETAKKYNVPLTLERYADHDFLADYDYVKSTGIFDYMTLYETGDVLAGDNNGNVVVTEQGKVQLVGLKMKRDAEK